MSNRITHDGVVTRTDGQTVTVQFVQHSACAGCHAKMLCSSGDAKQRSIEAQAYGQTYSIGEEVTVEVTSQLAWTAMFYAFGLPVVIALVVLFALMGVCGEMLSCLLTLSTLALYYVVLHQFRHRLDRKVVFLLHRKGI